MIFLFYNFFSFSFCTVRPGGVLLPVEKDTGSGKPAAPQATTPAVGPPAHPHDAKQRRSGR